jgi:hypothetical protein
MALYKNGNFLQRSDDASFNQIHHPGAPTPYSGIYRCVACGHEIAETRPRTLPPQNHHQHGADQGPIRWQLVVTHN